MTPAGTGDGAGGAESWTWAEVCARRLDRHHLSPSAGPATIPEVVSAVGAVHAQVLSAAELSVGLRVPGVTRTDIRDALWTERSLVKTFGPRGTVHLLATGDLPLWTAALRAIPPMPSPFAQDVQMTADQTDAVVAAIGSSLEDTTLTVDELSEALVDATGPWAGDLVMPAFGGMWPRWRQAITLAANRGELCFGPDRGRKVTYTNPQRWLPAAPAIDGDEALAALVRRYLLAFGPATSQHFARWLNAPRRWATDLFDSLAGDLRPVEVDGTVAWVNADDTLGSGRPHGVRLLPYFDAYTVGCQPRELVFPGRAAERALARGQAGNFPVLLVDGVAAGVWHQRRNGRRLEVTVEPLDRMSAAARRGLEAEVERVGEILEATPSLSIGEVTVGPHA
jgi:Winged helix DNA-binding domain